MSELTSSQTQPQPLRPDDALPPVQAPSATFIVQLFVIPGVIVLIIVSVWLLFMWIAQMGNDPATFVQALRNRNSGSWHAAVNLANALRSDKTGELRSDRQLARELTQILDEELDAGRGLNSSLEADAQAINMRIYLCWALGAFHLDTGLDSLLRAAVTQRSEAEIPVRTAALESLSVLIEHLGTSLDASRAAPALIKSANDEDRRVRSSAAFALGLLKYDPAQEQLVKLLDDPIADVRYNAALGLARHGRAECTEVLLEMLALDQSHALELEEGIQKEEKAEFQKFKAAMIHMNGLRGVEKLVAANPSVARADLRVAVEQLQASKSLPAEIRMKAKTVSAQLNPKAAPAAA